MPLIRLRYDELAYLYDKVFNPFPDIDPTQAQAGTNDFEILSSECRYHTITTSQPAYSHDIDKFLVIHLNVRSLLNAEKFEALQTFLHLTGVQWDAVCISESWLNDQVEINRNIDGYVSFFHNRSDRVGGGVVVYVRTSSVTSIKRLDIEGPTGSESVFLECQLPYSKVIIGQVYRPPDTCPVLFNEQMSIILDSIDISSKTAIIAGDFANSQECSTTDVVTTYLKKSVMTEKGAYSTVTDDQGGVWLLVGTDSGFEGTTTIYFMDLEVVATKK